MNKGKFLLLCIILSSFVLTVFTQQKPNIVFVFTDDQDTEMHSLGVMSKLHSLVTEKGAALKNSFVGNPLCCPSRSSLLTGRYPHNVGVTNNSISGGCSSPEWQSGLEKQSIAVFLQDAGYDTYYVGKYLNTYGFDEAGGVSHIPPGWNFWNDQVGNSVYYNYTLSVNGEGVYHGDNYETDYFTNVIRNTSLDYISNLSADQPFFMMISPPACHDPVTPEPKYENTLSSLQIPRTANFNIANKNKNWFVQYGNQPLSSSTVENLDEMYRNRLRTLLTVDDMVEDIVRALDAKNLLNNTYIVYSADNGFHLGHYSLPYDKREPYETDIRVPLIIRGPGIEEGITIPEATTNIDLSATFLDWAGIDIPPYFDGVSLKNLLNSKTNETNIMSTRSILIEYKGSFTDEPFLGCEFLGNNTGLDKCYWDYECKCGDARNNTYSCIRTLGSGTNEIYCLWHDSVGFEEYYNIELDPFELTNTISDLLPKYYNRLTTLLSFMSKCSGSRCSGLYYN